MNKDISSYNDTVESPELQAVCARLAAIIQSNLPEAATSKIWYAQPVWFINDNPIVGYNVTKKQQVNLMFWSGQSFNEPGLSPEGSFKAAEIKYDVVGDINEAQVQKWVKESAVTMWNYRDIRKNRGLAGML